MKLRTLLCAMSFLTAAVSACGGSEPDALDRMVEEIRQAAEIDCVCLEPQPSQGGSSRSECIAEQTFTEEHQACIRRSYAAAGIDPEPTARCFAEQLANYSACRRAGDPCENDCEHLMADEAYFACLKTSVAAEEAILQGCESEGAASGDDVD